MPVTYSAKRALRKSKRKAAVNLKTKIKMKSVLKIARATKNPELAPQAYQVIDRAAKHHLLHPNKAARLKSQIARFLAKSSAGSVKTAA
jgi:ribosomal protein S20